MQRSVLETILGAVIILIAVFFLAFSYKSADMTSGNGYEITANFSGTGGLKAGDPVRISGVNVGSVKRVELDPQTYLAIVTMGIEEDVKIPADTAAIISSDSLLGGRFLGLEPGGDEMVLEPGDAIQYTQAPQNLEQLLGKFVFSATENKNKEGNQTQTVASEPAPQNSAAPVAFDE